jgi:hypothetical protein
MSKTILTLLKILLATFLGRNMDFMGVFEKGGGS